MPKPYIDLQSITKSFGARVLFQDISFSISEGQRIGLIAENGTGKSTLLSIIVDKEGVDNGQIIYRKNLKIGMLVQEPKFNVGDTVLQACFGNNSNEEHLLKAKQILTQLNIIDLSQPILQLSGGQQRRVALASVLITEPDLLILDEPTNHLDLEMIEWLEGFLSRGNKTLLMVTHDRYFLDRICNSIIELADGRLYTYQGNYAYYLEKREERLNATAIEIQRANNLYRRELEWMRRQPQARGHKAKYREEAFYELEVKAKQKIEDRQVRLKSRNVYIGSKIFECQYVSKAFSPEKVILKDFYYNFARYEKMGIIGNNGTGKTTFIRLLLGEVQPDSGRFDIGETVKFGYFSQEGLHFDETKKVIDVVRDIAEDIDMGGGKRLTASQFLQHFLFTPEQQYNYVYKLSGGEKRKLHLCTILMRNPNFLILDEPTNDLDIKTLQVLEEYLQDFAGCVIIVSHDRYFMDKVVDHLLVFQGDGKVQDFPGNYTDYRMIENTKPSETPKASVQTQEKTKKTNNSQKLSFKEKREFEQLESEIIALEEEKSKIETDLCNSGTLSVEEITGLSCRLPIIQNKLEEKELRWLELSERA